MRPSKAVELSKYEYDECEKINTREFRLYNINRFLNFIEEDINQNNLVYEENERHIILYETEYGEKVGIAYPGKESVKKNKQFPYDMRPVLYTSDSRILKNQNFYDLYNIIEKIYKKSPETLFFCIISILFKMGFMIDVNLEDVRVYDYENELNTKILRFYNFDFNSDLIKYLDSQLEKFTALDKDGNSVEISLISYLMYYYLLFQQEDNKYYFRNGKKLRDQGRTSTALSSILFGGTLQKEILVSEALQKFISGKGIGRCSFDSLQKLTKNLIVYTNLKNKIINLCEEKKIKYNIGYVTIDDKKIKGLKIKSLGVFVITNEDYEFSNQLRKKGWNHIFYSNSKLDYQKLLQLITNIDG